MYFFLLGPVRHLSLLSFPTRRSSDLARRHDGLGLKGPGERLADELGRAGERERRLAADALLAAEPLADHLADLFERSEEHTSELQSQFHLVCRLLLEKKNAS